MKEALDVSSFMIPNKENAEIDVGDLDQDVLKEFIQDLAYESDEEIEDQLIVKAEEAIKAAQMLELWHLQQDVADRDGIEAIQSQIARLEKAKQVERHAGKQRKLDDWFQKSVNSFNFYVYYAYMC